MINNPLFAINDLDITSDSFNLLDVNKKGELIISRNFWDLKTVEKVVDVLYRLLLNEQKTIWIDQLEEAKLTFLANALISKTNLLPIQSLNLLRKVEKTMILHLVRDIKLDGLIVDILIDLSFEKNDCIETIRTHLLSLTQSEEMNYVIQILNECPELRQDPQCLKELEKLITFLAKKNLRTKTASVVSQMDTKSDKDFFFSIMSQIPNNDRKRAAELISIVLSQNHQPAWTTELLIDVPSNDLVEVLELSLPILDSIKESHVIKDILNLVAQIVPEHREHLIKASESTLKKISNGTKRCDLIRLMTSLSPQERLDILELGEIVFKHLNDIEPIILTIAINLVPENRKEMAELIAKLFGELKDEDLLRHLEKIPSHECLERLKSTIAILHPDMSPFQKINTLDLILNLPTEERELTYFLLKSVDDKNERSDLVALLLLHISEEKRLSLIKISLRLLETLKTGSAKANVLKMINSLHQTKQEELTEQAFWIFKLELNDSEKIDALQSLILWTYQSRDIEFVGLICQKLMPLSQDPHIKLKVYKYFFNSLPQIATFSNQEFSIESDILELNLLIKLQIGHHLINDLIQKCLQEDVASDYLPKISKYRTIVDYLLHHHELLLRKVIDFSVMDLVQQSEFVSLMTPNQLIDYIKEIEIDHRTLLETEIVYEKDTATILTFLKNAHQLILSAGTEEAKNYYKIHFTIHLLQKIPPNCLAIASKKYPHLLIHYLPHMKSLDLACVVPLLPNAMLLQKIDEIPFERVELKVDLLNYASLHVKKEWLEKKFTYPKELFDLNQELETKLNALSNSKNLEASSLIGLRVRLDQISLRIERVLKQLEYNCDQELKNLLEKQRGQIHSLLEKINLKVQSLQTLESFKEEIPEEFLDAFTAKPMRNPVIIPITNQRIDKTTLKNISRKEINGETTDIIPHPFTREDTLKKDYILDKPLKEKIKAYAKDHANLYVDKS